MDTAEYLYKALEELILVNQRFIDLVASEFCHEPRGERERAFTDFCFATGKAVHAFRYATDGEGDMSPNDLEAYMRRITSEEP